MTSSKSSRVGVLKGGPSAEREVSLVSGAECAKGLRAAGFDVVEIDVGEDLIAQLTRARVDVVFNALHGRWGEDGCVQGILEWMQLPYTHSGVYASALAMDKLRTKAVYTQAGLPVAHSIMARADDVRREHVLRPPYVVKPYNEGSSVGVYLVNEAANAPPQLDDDMPETVMVETFVPGRELTVAVMDGTPLLVTDIFTDGWYDYSAKYAAGGSRHQVPAQIPAEITDLCRDYAARAHVALGCRGLTRTDFRWDESKGSDGLILLETNTQPGMTPTSLAPEQAAAAGWDFPDLLAWMIKDASCDR